jgi:hypothetical protein
MHVMRFALWVPLMFGFACAEKDNDPAFGGGGIVTDDTGQVSGADPSAYEQVFDEVIAPKCRACHSGDRPAGDLSLETQEESYNTLLSGYVTPGDPDSSLLVERISLDIDDDSLMPPNAKLDDDKISIVVDWVSAGAPE